MEVLQEVVDEGRKWGIILDVARVVTLCLLFVALI